MSPVQQFSMSVPAQGIPNRIEVIKAIRCLTGMGLKEAKDASERFGQQTFGIHQPNFSNYIDPSIGIEDQFKILRNNGVAIGGPVQHILSELRKLGAQALEQGEDELANEILQLVLAEKIRRKDS